MINPYPNDVFEYLLVEGCEECEFMTRVGKSKRPIMFAEGLETKAKMQNNTKLLISRLAKQVIKEMKENI